MLFDSRGLTSSARCTNTLWPRLALPPLRWCGRPWPPASLLLCAAMPIPEVFFKLDGALELLQTDGDSSRWLTARPNRSRSQATVLLVATPNITTSSASWKSRFVPISWQRRQLPQYGALTDARRQVQPLDWFVGPGCGDDRRCGNDGWRDKSGRASQNNPAIELTGWWRAACTHRMTGCARCGKKPSRVRPESCSEGLDNPAGRHWRMDSAPLRRWPSAGRGSEAQTGRRQWQAERISILEIPHGYGPLVISRELSDCGRDGYSEVWPSH